ncbi:hypothetical protein M472_19070 [Sphingobacterium paucimobilis HER1398]|uniref:FecR protein domain-containing protein n=2 Tax=Sphingobacterium TaxID=28453 RepID=U2J7F2_9SPHI|nr:hypothetical protein M472_19070 [Sphingobacterium paucimobilis HER1398]
MSEEDVEDHILQLWDQLHSSTTTSMSEEESNQLFQRIVNSSLVQQDIEPAKQSTMGWFKRIGAVAAVAALILGTCTFLFLRRSVSTTDYAALPLDTAIIPGSKKAHVILEDGKSISLVGLESRDTIHTGSYLILNKGQEGISYHGKDGLANRNREVYNTLVTPLGGEYMVVLADGTKVWLNANSRLRYPTDFVTDVRTVELEGEAYFDVASLESGGKKVPFYVKTRTQTVEVLGTQFNINSYGGQITTTLVEGKVALRYKGVSKPCLLSPNYQLIYTEHTHTYEKKEIDPYYFTAWKDGSFAFDNTPLTAVMADISRWYNVEFNYETDVSDVYFSGKISKLESFESLLQTIQWTGSVKFKINGRRVTIRK